LCRGDSGYSAVGAVTGCTHPEETRSLRQILFCSFLLVPGYGAQGGTAEDVAAYLSRGNGAIVNASRSLLLAWKDEPGGAASFADLTRAKALRMRDEIASAVLEAAR
jgi:orotidine-5'-phosphate decarboxylase